MGTIRNRMTIVYHYNFEEITKVRESAIMYFESIMQGYNIDYNVRESMVSPILASPVNGEYSFVIMGDCSKLGWNMSEDFEKHRLKWAKQEAGNVQNIIILDFGEGDQKAFCEEIHSLN